MSMYFEENYMHGLNEDEIMAVEGLLMLSLSDDNDDELNTTFIQDDDEENLYPTIPDWRYMNAG